MNHTENTEIGELTREILGKGFTGLEIEIIPAMDDRESFASVTAADYTRPEDRGNITIEAGSMIVALRLVVNAIRFERHEPSLEEELANLIAADTAHTDAPPVEIGPNACCGCGSRKPLIVERKYLQTVLWENGRVNPPLHSSRTQPGEIGTCPDCGRHYTFGP